MTNSVTSLVAAALCASSLTTAAAPPAKSPPVDPVYTLHVLQYGVGRGASDIPSVDLTRFETSQECEGAMRAIFANIYRVRAGFCLNRHQQTVVRCYVTTKSHESEIVSCQTIPEAPRVALMPANQSIAIDPAGYVRANNDGVYFTRSDAPQVITYSYFYNAKTDQLCTVDYTAGVRDDLCRDRSQLKANGAAARLANLGARIMRDFHTVSEMSTIQKTHSPAIQPLLGQRNTTLQMK
jgi:hypothetical protein